MRTPLSSLQAFIHDAEKFRGSTGSEPLARWLAVAQSAERLSLLPPKGRAEYLSRLADSVLPARGERPTQIEGDGRLPLDDLTRLSERIRLEVEDMERAGCFELALCTVSAVCRMMSKSSGAGRLLATAHMGRVMRQLGELNAAVDCYQSVVGDAIDDVDPAVEAIAYNGLGIVAKLRGNLPAQLSHFTNALSRAPRGSPAEIMAHQGLMIVSIAQHHLADALLHGWHAHDLAPAESETQLEIINNMANAALRSGFPAAARNGFEHTLQRTQLARLRMPAIGGAHRAAATLGDEEAVERFEGLGTQQIAIDAPPWERAQYYLLCAESWQVLGNFDRRDGHIQSGETIADEFGYHEVRMKLEALRHAAPEVVAMHDVSAPYADSYDSALRPGIERLQTLAV